MWSSIATLPSLRPIHTMSGGAETEKGDGEANRGIHFPHMSCPPPPSAAARVLTTPYMQCPYRCAKGKRCHGARVSNEGAARALHTPPTLCPSSAPGCTPCSRTWSGVLKQSGVVTCSKSGLMDAAAHMCPGAQCARAHRAGGTPNGCVGAGQRVAQCLRCGGLGVGVWSAITTAQHTAAASSSCRSTRRWVNLCPAVPLPPEVPQPFVRELGLWSVRRQWPFPMGRSSGGHRVPQTSRSDVHFDQVTAHNGCMVPRSSEGADSVCRTTFGVKHRPPPPPCGPRGGGGASQGLADNRQQWRRPDDGWPVPSGHAVGCEVSGCALVLAPAVQGTQTTRHPPTPPTRNGCR